MQKFTLKSKLFIQI